MTGNLLEIELPKHFADGALLNNVLYSVGRENKNLKLLVNIHEWLKPGSLLLVSDPKP